LSEETGVADKSREGADEEVTEVLKVIRQLEEYRQELKRLRRLLKDTEKPDTSRPTRSLNNIKGNIASYIS
jgi:phage host-nuclease inhibitor protein Gam